MDVAVMVKRGGGSPPGEAPAMAVSSADALHPVVGHSEAPPETAADRWAGVIAASVVSMSAQVETVALNLAASMSAVLMTGAPMNAVLMIAGPVTVVLVIAGLMNAAQRIAGLVIGARVAVVSRAEKAASCVQVARSDLISVLMNNPAAKPVLMAPRVSRMICFGVVTPPRQHWRPVGPSIASGAPVRCEVLPSSWRYCGRRKRLACWWKKSPGRVWRR